MTNKLFVQIKWTSGIKSGVCGVGFTIIVRKCVKYFNRKTRLASIINCCHVQL